MKKLNTHCIRNCCDLVQCLLCHVMSRVISWPGRRYDEACSCSAALTSWQECYETHAPPSSVGTGSNSMQPCQRVWWTTAVYLCVKVIWTHWNISMVWQLCIYVSRSYEQTMVWTLCYRFNILQYLMYSIVRRVYSKAHGVFNMAKCKINYPLICLMYINYI